MRRRKGKESPLGIILLVLLLSGIFRIGIGGILSILLGGAALVAALVIFFVVRASRKSSDNDHKTGNGPVDVSTHGSYQRPAQTGSTGNRTSASASYQTQQRPANPGPVERPVTPKPQPKPTYSPEVQAVVDEGERAHKEMEHLYATIPDLAVKAKIRELIDVSDKITADAVNDPTDVPQIRKFQNYYLPTTIKLLNAYDRMGAQGIQGENITHTMESINEMLDTAIDAYKRLLDNLFANQALDVETDIEVMNTLLQREGLAGGGTGFGK